MGGRAHFHTHTRKHEHAQGLLRRVGNTRSLSGTYCTVPPVMSLLINTYIHTQANTHTTWILGVCMADTASREGV